jgi:cytidylate kinase
MHILRIEHPVQDYNGWKKVFDSDPINREKSGVKRYTILKETDNPNFVMIDLEFETAKEAEEVSASLHKIWKEMKEKIMHDPRTKIVEVVERKEY